MSERPTIVVTGASGFLGTRLVRALRPTWRVVAIDRQPRGETVVDDDDPDVVWHRIDLADPGSVAATLDAIRRDGGALALVHLAAYYDFTDDDHPEYRRTNVDATRLLVEGALDLGLELFLFASSVAACDFTAPGRPITEDTPADGDHIYSVTKREGEEIVRAYADRLPSCIVRFAALFSDWCEYPPLYFLLDTWLSGRWNARMLAGRGRSAFPYLHVRDAVSMVLRVLDQRRALEPAETLIAGVDGVVSHRDLFERTTSYAFGDPRTPLFVPRPLCRPGMWIRDAAGRVLGDRPFERPWMARYIDRELAIDARRTRRRLGWAPRERLDILHRIPFLIENARTSRMEWHGRNLDALEHHAFRPRFRVYGLVRKFEVELERSFVARLDAMGDAVGSADERRRTGRVALRALIQAIRTGEKSPFTLYCRSLAERQAARGTPARLVIDVVRALGTVCVEVLGREAVADATDVRAEMRRSVEGTIEFGVDGVLEVYEEETRR